VRTVVDDILRAEALRLDLRYRCKDCVHFEPRSGACAEGFPNEGHRDRAVEHDEAIEFCKSFELG